MKIKAAVLEGLQHIEMKEIELEPLKKGEISVKIEYVGICGSDMHFFEHGRIGDHVIEYPFILGHECAGTVVAVAPDVRDIKIGDRVALEPGIPCGHCEFCKEGRYNLCPDMAFMASPPQNGSLREIVNHPAHMAFKLPDSMSTLEGALLEPLAVGMHAVKHGGVTPGKSVAILGSGCIGLVTLLACKAAGASVIAVSDLFDNRLEKAKELGATHVFNPQKDGDFTNIRNFTNGEGFDVVFETAGSKVTASQTSYLVRRGGTIVIAGSVLGDTPFNFRNLSVLEATLKTIWRYRNIYPEAIQQVSSGRINLKSIATDEFSFDDCQNAFVSSIKNKNEIVKSYIKF